MGRIVLSSVAAVLSAGGLIAGVPALPEVQVRAVRLTDAAASLQDLLDQQLSSNYSMFQDILAANDTMVGGEQDVMESLASLYPAAQQELATNALRSMFDSMNLTMGAGQGSFLGLDGVRELLETPTAAPGYFLPSDLNASLLLPGSSATSASFGGLQGALGQELVFAGQLSALISGSAVAGDLGQLFANLEAAAVAFDQQLYAAELAFNQALVAQELATVQAAFGDADGSDSVLNGVINRGFNMMNMMYDAQEQSVNNLLGLTAAQGYDPTELTQSLLLGSAAQIFNDGSVGGLTGMADQAAAQLTDLLGIDQTQLTFALNNFDADGLSTALQDWADNDVLAAGPFGDVFDLGQGGDLSPLIADIAAIWDAILGSGSP